MAFDTSFQILDWFSGQMGHELSLLRLQSDRKTQFKKDQDTDIKTRSESLPAMATVACLGPCQTSVMKHFV